MMKFTFIVVIKNRLRIVIRILLLLGCYLIVGCNHLLYPAERQPFVVQKSIRPVPLDLSIPVYKNLTEPFLHAWYFPAQSKIRKGLVVHFHGNGQNLSTHFLFMSWIVDYGYDYLIFDYRGYGASSGDSTTQEKTVEDGLAVFKYLHENFKDLPLIAFGQSLGSNVLIRTLQELNKVGLREQLPALVVLDSSFLSYQRAASRVLGQNWFLYPLKPLAYVLLSDEWSAEKRMARTPAIPALFFHGSKDKTIDYELGKETFSLWPGPKTFVTQVDGGHTSAFSESRFISSRSVLLRCADYALNKKTMFEDCAQ